jgi:hypothetical protein
MCLSNKPTPNNTLQQLNEKVIKTKVNWVTQSFLSEICQPCMSNSPAARLRNRYGQCHLHNISVPGDAESSIVFVVMATPSRRKTAIQQELQLTFSAMPAVAARVPLTLLSLQTSCS